MTDTHGTPSPAAPAASTPADAGSTASVGADDTSVIDNSAEFMGLGGFDDAEEIPASPEPVAPTPPAGGEPAAPVAPAPASKPDAAAPAPAQTAPQTTPPAKQEGGPQEPQAPAGAPASSPAEPQSLVEQLDANRDAMINALAQDVFKLSKEDAEALELDVIGNTPKLLARVYYESVKTTINHIQNMVPRLIEQYMTVNKAREEVENAFYGKFTGLDKAKHHADVMQFATTFRQVNPRVTQDELWALVAASVASKYGISAQAAAQVLQGVNGGAPPRPPAQQPFAPARPGVSVRTTPEPESEFAGLGRDYGDEEG